MWSVFPRSPGARPLPSPDTRRSRDGEMTAELEVGVSYTRKVGVEHNVINANDYFLSFVEIELKP